MRRIKHIAEYLYYFIYGKLMAALRYDPHYISGKWFQSSHKGIGATGWQWVCHDARMCRKLGVNQNVPWPCSPRIQVVNPENIIFHPDDLNNFQGFGNYFQAIGKITIGQGTYIAPNVGIITSNHDFKNLDCHLPPKDVVIMEKCWVGMNSMILPGVVLGPQTIVGAGSVVTKSFPEGNCVIVGNPARKVDCERNEFIADK